jgi:ferrous iron transport protein B
MQQLLVALLVFVCGVYAAWSLCPKVPRRWLATVLLKLPLPGWCQKPLQAAVRMQGGCGCDGCDAPAVVKPKPVVFVRKR